MSHFTWSNLLSDLLSDLLSGLPFLLPFLKASTLWHLLYSLLSAIIFLLLGFFALKALRDKRTGHIPEGRFNLKGFFELFVEQMDRLSTSIIGPEGRSFLPLFCFFFLFIWIQNLLGLVPGFLPPSQNLNCTMALGLFSFLAYNYYGVKKHGLGYFKQFLGPVLFLAPLFICIEVLSHIFRSVSLGVRLFGNMMGDHTIISIFLEMTPFFIPVIFYFLGLFVCSLQAFVFTILSMVYVSLSISDDH